MNLTVAIVLQGDPPHIEQTIATLLSQGYFLGSVSMLCIDDGASRKATAQGVPGGTTVGRDRRS